jgi:hypothetical protein
LKYERYSSCIAVLVSEAPIFLTIFTTCYTLFSCSAIKVRIERISLLYLPWRVDYCVVLFELQAREGFGVGTHL